MRESLFEKLKKKELSFIKELRKINNILNQSNITYSYFEQSFKLSPFNVFYEEFSYALLDIFETSSDNSYINSDNLNFLIDEVFQVNDNLSLDSFLDYLEFFKTLLNYDSNLYNTDVNQIKMIIDSDCEKLGYSFKVGENNVYKTMLKHPIAEAVALEVKESIRDKIYDYLIIREGRVEEKRKTIKSLADDVEIICRKYSNITEYSKLKQFAQCVRHTKDDPIREFLFYYNEEEKWLDKIFEMIIGVLSFTETKKIVSEIKELENNRVEDQGK